MKIIEDNLTSDAIINFLKEHLEDMKAITPPGSVHALNLDGLRVPEITFWSMWDDDDLVGSGALKALNGNYKNCGEIKSMRTSRQSRGKGVGSSMLEHIISTAQSRQYNSLYLETGSFEAFEPARALYTKYGFEYCPPFADYKEDPNSVFMVKHLTT